MSEQAENNAIDAKAIYQWLKIVIQCEKTAYGVERDNTQPQEERNIAAPHRRWIAAGLEEASKYSQQDKEYDCHGSCKHRATPQNVQKSGQK